MRDEERPSEPTHAPADARRAPEVDPERARAIAEHGIFLRRLFAATPRAWASTGLIAINVGVFALMAALGVSVVTPQPSDLVRWGANYGPAILDGEWWRLFASMFLHFGILHIGFNMWVLKSVGPFLERMIGHSAYLALYLVSGLFSSVCAVWWNPLAVSAGASGAIFGVAGGLIGCILAKPPEIPAGFAAQLKKSLFTFVLLNVVLGMAVPQIALSAHLGGLVAGCAGGYVLAKGGLSIGRPRYRREALFVAVGLAFVALGTRLPPRPSSPYLAAQVALVDGFRSAARRYDEQLGRLRSGEIDEGQFADFVRDELLPPWREARSRVDALHDVPEEDARWIARLRAFAEHQQRSWELLVQSIREKDSKLAEQAMAERRQAEELLAEIRRDGEEPGDGDR